MRLLVPVFAVPPPATWNVPVIRSKNFREPHSWDEGVEKLSGRETEEGFPPALVLVLHEGFPDLPGCPRCLLSRPVNLNLDKGIISIMTEPTQKPPNSGLTINSSREENGSVPRR